MAFFATSHGKSAGDGAARTLKRIATKASLQSLYDKHILTAFYLYQFACSEIRGMQFAFASSAEYDQEAKLLEARLEISRTIPGTLKLHCIIPCGMDIVEVKQFSRKTRKSDLRKEIRVTYCFTTIPH